MSFQSHSISLLKKLKTEIKLSEQVAIQKAKNLSQYKDWEGIKDAFEKGSFSESLYKRTKEKFGDKIDGLRKELSEANNRANFIKSKISRVIAQDSSLSCLLFFDDFEESDKGNLIIKGKNLYVKDNRTQYSDVILINSKNEILFTVRNKNDNFEPGKYCLPGGHIEEDEEPAAAAVRELEEETGISLKESQIKPCGQYFDRKSHINYFCAHYDGDPVVLDEREQQQFEWVSIDDIGDKPLLMNLRENFKNIIEIPKSILNPLADNAKKYYFSGDEITSEELLERLRILENLHKGFLEGEVFLQDYENKKNIFNLEKGCKIEDFLFIDSQGDFYWGASYNDLEKAYYKNNWLNRKLGRVNMFYGGSDGGGSGKDSKKDDGFKAAADEYLTDLFQRWEISLPWGDKNKPIDNRYSTIKFGIFSEWTDLDKGKVTSKKKHGSACYNDLKYELINSMKTPGKGIRRVFIRISKNGDKVPFYFDNGKVKPFNVLDMSSYKYVMYVDRDSDKKPVVYEYEPHRVISERWAVKDGQKTAYRSSKTPENIKLFQVYLDSNVQDKK